MHKIFTICIIAVLAGTAVDCIPDPPATTPQQTIRMTLSAYAVGPALLPARRVSASLPNFSKRRWIDSSLDAVPPLAAYWILSTGRAADSSPPRLKSESAEVSL
jgi:hypothetical protein